MTQNTPTYRDEELGAALRSLETPEHGPHFDSELQQRLAAEGLPRLDSRVPRRKSRRRVWRPVVAVAFAAAALAVALPVADRVGGSEVASAAEVQAQVRDSLGSLETLSGTLVSRCPGCPDEAGPVRLEFVLTADGDFRLAGPGAREVVTYDASTGVVRSMGPSSSITGEPTIFYAERRGVAPGPPDPGMPGLFELEDFGDYVRALFAAGDPRVQEVVYDGRPAWQLETDTAPNAIVPKFTGDAFQIMVDRETGIPVRVVERKSGRLIRELRVERLEVDGELAPDTFRLRFPAGAEVMHSNDGFRRVALDDVRSIVGYAPLVPRWVPAGYEVAEVAIAERAGPTGKEAGNPVSRNVVSLAYRRGFDQLVVTTRLAGTGDWSDPVATGEGYIDTPRVVTIVRGALRGVSAEAVIEPRGIPHAWVQHGDLVVTVAGGLSDKELLRVLESLERRG